MIFTREQLQHLYDTNAVFIQVLPDADYSNEWDRHFVIYTSTWMSWEDNNKVFDCEAFVTKDPNVLMERIIQASAFDGSWYNKSKRVCKTEEIPPKE